MTTIRFLYGVYFLNWKYCTNLESNTCHSIVLIFEQQLFMFLPSVLDFYLSHTHTDRRRQIQYAASPLLACRVIGITWPQSTCRAEQAVLACTRNLRYQKLLLNQTTRVTSDYISGEWIKLASAFRYRSPAQSQIATRVWSAACNITIHRTMACARDHTVNKFMAATNGSS